jgi:CheY-like chemotaxis protein
MQGNDHQGADRPLASILVVEDEWLIAEQYRQVLEDAGYRVCACVADAESAIEAASQYRPDLVVTDIRLARGSSGYDAAEQIFRLLGVRSLVVSGTQSQGPAPMAIAAQLGKPCTSEDFLGAVGAALQRPSR